MDRTFNKFVWNQFGQRPSTMSIGNEKKIGSPWKTISSRLKVYPSLNVTNVAPLITSLTFKNWCEIVRSNDQTTLPTCELTLYDEETVTPYRCLHEKSFEEETIESSKKICQKENIQDFDKCSSINQLKQRALTFCNVRGKIFNNQLRSLISCGLARFNAIEFDCCSLKGNDEITSCYSTF